jgi:hypothetical protein
MQNKGNWRFSGAKQNKKMRGEVTMGTSAHALCMIAENR